MSTKRRASSQSNTGSHVRRVREERRKESLERKDSSLGSQDFQEGVRKRVHPLNQHYLLICSIHFSQEVFRHNSVDRALR